MSELSFIENFANTKWNTIFDWLNTLQSQVSIKASNIYNSCDIRYSGFKVANVDCNLFPAGFKNLSSDGIRRSTQEMISFINTKKQNGLLDKNAKNIIIVSESHTRNLPYLHGVLQLKNIFENAGFNVRIATFDLKKFKVKLSGNVIEVYKLIKKDNKIYLECDGYKNQNTTSMAEKSNEGDIIFENCPETGRQIIKDKALNLFEADFLVINNDMTVQSPPALQDTNIKTFPETRLGWHLRKKSSHFVKYKEIVEQFSKYFNIDPWFFSAFFESVDNIDIKEGIGLDILARSVENIFSKVSEKYKEYNIKLEPKVYAKANAGTYGMGVMMLNNVEEVENLNKAGRNKLDSIKAGVKNTSFVIQEGVPSLINIDNNPAELVSYGFNLKPCDFFYRYHPDKDSNNSLNAPGARFMNKLNFDLIFKDNLTSLNTDVIKEIAILRLSYLASSLAFISAGTE